MFMVRKKWMFGFLGMISIGVVVFVIQQINTPVETQDSSCLVNDSRHNGCVEDTALVEPHDFSVVENMVDVRKVVVAGKAENMLISNSANSLSVAPQEEDPGSIVKDKIVVPMSSYETREIELAESKTPNNK